MLSCLEPMADPSHMHKAKIMPQGDILEDLPLITNLEETKATSTYVVEKVKQAKDTEVRLFDCEMR